MARHRQPARSKRRPQSKRRKSLRSTPRSTKPRHHRPKLVKSPPQKFRLRLGKVEIVKGSELFERRVYGLKEGKKRALRRMGKLGKRISSKQVPRTPAVKVGRLPRGTKERKRIVKIKVLVKARIKGRIGYFTKTLKLKGGRTGKAAKKIARDFVQRIGVAYVGSKYEVRALSYDVQFEEEAA